MEKPQPSQTYHVKIREQGEGESAESCPHCARTVLRKNMFRHMRKAHKDLITEQLIPPGIIRCDICGIFIKEDRIVRHRKKAHDIKPEPLRPLGIQILAKITAGNRPKATTTLQKCDACRGRVVFLDMGRNKTKAFDVDSNGFLLGTHACEGTPKSESVRTISGGIIDSNRRRH